MNCHGLAKVKDEEVAVLKRGNALFQKVLGVIHRLSCAVTSVSTPDFRTMILPWNEAPINQVFTSSKCTA